MATPPPPPPLPPASAPDFCTVLSESRRILWAHSRHFLALSVLFLLPISFSVTVFPTLHRFLIDSSSSSSNPHHVQALLRQSLLLRGQPPQQQRSGVLLGGGYTYFLTLLSMCGACSITYSVVQGFYGRPVKFLSAIKSIGRCSFRIVATHICTLAITSFLMVIVSGILAFLKGVELAVVQEISQSAPYFEGLVFSIVGVLLLVLAYLQVQWVLAYVIVVVESGYGGFYYPLRRSAYLVKGMRGVTLSLTLFFGVLSGSLVWTATRWTSSEEEESVMDGNGNGWDYVVQIVTTSSFLMMLMLISLSANAVLYIYCKAVHGELAMEVAEVYVGFPSDDDKAS